jgi:hypothetical protein
VLSALACTASRTPAPTRIAAAKASTGEIEAMPARVEVELDIFSGMPNPTWVLANDQADSFVEQLAALSRTSARELSGNLGYRGFIVQLTQGAGTESIHIQTGTVQISRGATKVYANDKDRRLERWLLNTGKPHMKNEVFEMVEREIR